MSRIKVFSTKSHYDALCGVPFQVQVKVSADSQTTVKVCFEISASACSFSPGNEKMKCEESFVTSPPNLRVTKTYTLTVDCDPKPETYGAILTIKAIDVDTGESGSTTPGLTIKCQ
jgi:hypothetical protein